MAHRRPARALVSASGSAPILIAAVASVLGACANLGPDSGAIDPTTHERPRIIAPEPRAVPLGRTDRRDEQLLRAVDTGIATTPVTAARVRTRDTGSGRDTPRSHTVVRGDTLWDIAGRFLDEPWLWPEVWKDNPQIADPHLIYPGDIIALEYVNGEPTLTLDRGGRRARLGGNRERAPATADRLIDSGTVRRSPQVRSVSLEDAVPMISGETIRQFLVHPRVLDLAAIEGAPYVVGNFDGRLISAAGHQVYARGDIQGEQTRYGVYRRSKALVDPMTEELLGYEVTHVADARLMNIGDPSTLTIVGNRMETIAGDILLPISGRGAQHVYETRLPDVDGEGRIISLVDAISQSGRNQVIVLNIGARDGIASGDVLAIEARGGTLIDRHVRGAREVVELPNTRTGVVMVFETFDKVSYALVMESTRPVALDDIVTGI